MIPRMGSGIAPRTGIPRESGDDPLLENLPIDGWVVFPARAGMIQCFNGRCSMMYCIPRESGDDPSAHQPPSPMAAYSPRERG